MGALWTQEAKLQCLLEVEKAVAQSQSELGLIPAEAAEAIAKLAKIDAARIAEIELTTKHDVIAFVSQVAESIGEWGRYLHFGLTSSDVLDTALSLQVKKSSTLIDQGLRNLEKALEKKMTEHVGTLCAGRTHGMHAEPTTFGYKLAGFFAELKRNQERWHQAKEQFFIGKLSGAVGTYSAQSQEVETKVCKKLGLTPEKIATQVIPRDRHAQLILALTMIGTGLERLATELRHLQRTELGEVTEGFGKGQKGSSAMPHKRNPISAENLTGISRLLRGYALATLENVALWHERDISHSSVERVVFPDAFIVTDYAIDRMTQLVAGLEVNVEKMKLNMEASQGQLMSSHFLLALIEKGWSREKAYEKVQSLSHKLKNQENLQDAAIADVEVAGVLSESEMEEIFSGRRHVAKVKGIIEDLLRG